MWSHSDSALRIQVHTFKVYRSTLPWGNSNSIQVAAINVRGEVAATVWPIDDPPPPAPDEPIVVASGQVLTGDFDLRSRIPDIATLRKSSDTLVVWSYTLKPVQSPAIGKASGVASFIARSGA